MLSVSIAVESRHWVGSWMNIAIRPTVAVRVFATPAVATEEGPTGPRYRRTNVGCGASWIVATAITIDVVPLEQGLRAMHLQAAGLASHVEWGRTVAVAVRTAPAVEGGLTVFATQPSAGTMDAMLAVKCSRLSPTIIVGVMPLRGSLEGINKSAGCAVHKSVGSEKPSLSTSSLASRSWRLITLDPSSDG